MSARFEIGLATAADDDALRQVMRNTPTPGSISLGWHREPSYFAAAAVGGRFRQTVVIRDRMQAGRIVGMGERSISPVYLNGQVTPLGYLSGLRGLPEYRGGTLLARGYRYLRQLHQDGRTMLYLTTIAAGNSVALSTLTAGRGPLPRYHAAGRLFTLLLSSRGEIGAAEVDGVTVRRGTQQQLPQLIRFWNEVGAQRQFFPCLSEQDFVGDGALYRDLTPAQIWIAWRGSRPCGTLAVWNQASFRQTVVAHLPWWLRAVRPAYNLVATWRGQPAMPTVGQRVPYLTAALCVVEGNDPRLFKLLLAAALAGQEFSSPRFLAIGMHESDPLLSLGQRLALLQYVTHVFLVGWSDCDTMRQTLDSRSWYLELGRL